MAASGNTITVTVSVAVPVKLDDGSLAVFEGYRVQHNMGLGPFIGALRLDPQLKLDELRAHGVPAADIVAARETEAFAGLMRMQAARARTYYARAFAALPASDRRAQRTGLIMAAIYQALLDEIEREGFRVLSRRTSLTPLRKLWIASKTWLAT